MLVVRAVIKEEPSKASRFMKIDMRASFIHVINAIIKELPNRVFRYMQNVNILE